MERGQHPVKDLPTTEGSTEPIKTAEQHPDMHTAWSDELPHDNIDWSEPTTLDNLTPALTVRMNTGGETEATDKPRTIGLVTSPPTRVDNFIERHSRGKIAVPDYYKDFSDLEAPTGPSDEQGRETTLTPVILEGGVRALNGKGRYSIDEFTIHDCLPEGAIVRRHIDGKNYGAAFIAAGITELGI